MPVDTHYARSGDLRIAYQVVGEGPLDLVFVPGFISNLDLYWDEPNMAHFLSRLGSFSRLILFDKRGTGLSDRLGNLPSLEERMDDVRAVMDAVGSEKAALFGISEGGAMSMLFAATYPERTQALILYGTYADFHTWVLPHERFEPFLEKIDRTWGQGESLTAFAPTKVGGRALPAMVGALRAARRQPVGRDRAHAHEQPDRRAPHPADDPRPDPGSAPRGRHAGQCRGRPLSRGQHSRREIRRVPRHRPRPVGRRCEPVADEIEEFLTGTHAESEPDRVLATVLFTDIVDSTGRAEEMGDRAWRVLLDQHDRIVRGEIGRFRGREIKTLGDGFLATFDGPARAVRCAGAIIEALRTLSLQVRCGVHTGEIEMMGDDIGGIAVHIASRIAALADGREVLVSRTVRDLVAGSNLHLEDRGAFALKGLTERMSLFAAVGSQRA